MKNYLIPAIGILILVLVLAACGTAKNGRKCDGRKGQKTPMGLL